MAKRTTRDSFQSARQPDQAPLRDKDNAAPTLKPVMPHRPAPNLAPPGMSGIRTGIGERSPDPDPSQDMRFLPEYEERGLAYDHGIEVASAVHTEGRVLTMPGYSFIARVGEEPNRDGIDGGKIDQLVLMKDGRTVASYDRGWSKEPETPEAREAIHRIRKGLDDTTQERQFQSSHDPENDHDISR